MLEILAPAGNEVCGKIALNNGANAIYLGYSDFSARKNAENFDMDGLKNMITYAHILGAKVYVTMNTIVKDSEVETFIKMIDALEDHDDVQNVYHNVDLPDEE